MLDKVGYPGNQEHGEEACSGFVRLSWALSHKHFEALHSRTETEKPICGSW